jgi:peptide-methionine (S)-S-oxide reductase
MSTSPELPDSAPRKRLPVKPSEEHLRKQAKRLAKQRALELAAAQHQLAKEYGCKNWAELMHVVEVMNRGADQLANVKREVEPLPKAVRARDMALVRRILESGAFTQHDLDAGLAHAAWYGGDDPAVLAQRKALFDLLLEQGADPDGQYGSNYGPIVFGTGECLDVHGLRWLLEAGADLTFPPLETKYGRQCPMGAILGAYARGSNAAKHAYIELLLERGAFIPPEVTPAMLAIHRGDAEGLARLLEADRGLARQTFREMPYGNIHLSGATLLHCAAEFDEIECCRVLFDHYADINAKAEVIDGVGGQTPIYHVINSGWGSHFATLEFLAARGRARIDMKVRATWRTFDGPRTKAVTPLEYAQEPGDEKWRKNREAELALLAALENPGATPDTNGSLADPGPGVEWGPLFSAAGAGRVDIARELLERGADVNARNPQGNTPLWFACQSPANADDRVAVARLLIAAGAQVRAACEYNATALHYAAARGPLEMVELLIRSGAKEWQVDVRGKKPIDYAREFGSSPDNEPIIQLLDRPVMRDPIFREAVRAIHVGDVAALQTLLREHPHLVHERVVEPDCYGQDYFRDPKLIWFVANNPNLVQGMAANILETAKALIDAGAEPADLNYTLGLVMTSQPAREAKLQRPLMRLLLENGAAVTRDDLCGALGHGEKEAIAALLESGMALSAPLAAGLGMAAELAQLIKTATPEERHAAFSLAVINREVAAARLCLDAGAEVNARLLVHKHSTAAHQAVVNDDVAMLRLLVERGASLDIKDSLWNSTPLGWAVHTKKAAAENYLRGAGNDDLRP